MSINTLIAMRYVKLIAWLGPKNKPNSNPIKPKTNPIQSQFKPKQTQFWANIKGVKAKTNPIKACPERSRMGQFHLLRIWSLEMIEISQFLLYLDKTVSLRNEKINLLFSPVRRRLL
ncbi:MAG: hypothetical protein FVQ84_20630 [Planctomycetes bacterium]|nr:hypothetical protein [Planctomycetota bacterium]